MVWISTVYKQNGTRTEITSDHNLLQLGGPFDKEPLMNESPARGRMNIQGVSIL
jgi:hypothetical protein